MAVPRRALLAITLLLQMITLVLSHGKPNNDKKTVTYDGRSIIVGGKRDIFFSGSIHYSRSTPDMWPTILKKAKHGGLNAISTYVFWNIHEPVRGQFNFEGNNDLVKFLKLIDEHGMYAILRIGPFIEAEWNHGGFPFWLREVPNITFRSDNEPFKFHMKRYSEMIINKVKDANLFFPQGGPIILAQIENEYNNIQLAFKENGDEYVQWAGNMALGLDAGVPWIMCKQRDAPGPVINTCNGRHCGDTFTGPNRPDKPALWTENWTAQYRVFGDPPSQRAAEDLAYAVARFFSKKGTLTNYYMYHGGTNFGRTASTFVTSRYYDEAPIDEYGMIRGPKWGHLKDLHSALRLCRKALLWGTHAFQPLGIGLEALFFEKAGTNICAAFLTNTNSKISATVRFRGTNYHLPAHSISILPDCKTVVFNTQTIVAQHNTRTFVTSKRASKNLKWEMFQESIPTTNEVPVSSPGPLELYGLNRDVTDYAWYTTSLRLHSRDLSWKHDIRPVLRIASLGHALLAFVNGEYVGTEHGSNIEKSFLFQKAINLKSGVNYIAILAMTVGLPNSGVYVEKRYAGPRDISILGLNTGTLDLTENGWGHEVGLIGERLSIFTEKGSHKVKWSSGGTGAALTWYKTHFDAPGGSNPVGMVLNNLTKGMVWVNGKSIGRYWNSYLSPLGSPSQTEYHVPRSFLKAENNLLVVLEESGGSTDGVEFLTTHRDRICSLITEQHGPHVGSWERKDSQIRAVAVDVKSSAQLQCPDEKVVIDVEFASFGDPYGVCGALVHGTCSSHDPKAVVEKFCMGKNQCVIPIERGVFNAENVCPNMAMTLAVQVRCGLEKNRNHAN